MGHRQQAGVAAERVSENGLFAGVADAVREQQVDATDDVVEGAIVASEVSAGAPDVGQAVAGGTAKVRLEHDVAAIDHQLGSDIHLAVAAVVRATVDERHDRRSSQRNALWQEGVAVQQHVALAAPVHRQHVGQLGGGHSGFAFALEQRRQYILRGVIEKQPVVLPVRLRCLQQPAPAVIAGADIQIGAGQPGLQRRDPRVGRARSPVPHQAVRPIGDGEPVLAIGLHQDGHCIGNAARVAVQGFPSITAGIVSLQRHPVFAVVRQRPDAGFGIGNRAALLR